ADASPLIEDRAQSMVAYVKRAVEFLLGFGKIGGGLLLILCARRGFDQRDSSIEARADAVGIKLERLAKGIFGDYKLLLFEHPKAEHKKDRVLAIVYLPRSLQLFKRFAVLALPEQFLSEREMRVKVVVEPRDGLAQEGHAVLGLAFAQLCNRLFVARSCLLW